jgi:hypothetical protein
MSDVLWELPVPSSQWTRGPSFAALMKRQCELSYFVESDDGDRKASIIFDGVEAYRCTYMTARSVAMIRAAYDRIVRLGETEWLVEVRQAVHEFYSRRRSAPPMLQHLMICVDDGPCYEIICTTFTPDAVI